MGQYSTDKDYDKIGPTAILCAKLRAEWTKLPYSKEMINGLGTNSSLGANLHKNHSSKISPSLMPIVLLLEGRHMSMNEAISQAEPSVVLEIASGLSSRGLEFAEKGISYVETDLPDVISIKKKILQNMSETYPDCLHTMSLNPLNTKEIMDAGKSLNKKPIIIAHEGLLMYLTQAEKAKLRDNISLFLKTYSPNGAWITTDFSSRAPEGENLSVKSVLQEIQNHTGRPFSRFESDDEVYEFLAAGGLKGKVIPNDDVLSQLSCLDILGINKEEIKRISAISRPWIIRLDR